MVQQRQHHVDAVALGLLEHAIELPRAVEPLRVVAEPGVVPLDAERPRRHPDASEVRALLGEPSEPVVVGEAAATVVPAGVLADREVRRAVVEREVARIAPADAKEAATARRAHLQRRVRQDGDRVALADDPPPAPPARPVGREADQEVRVADRRQALAAAHEAALVALVPERRDVERPAAGRHELGADVDLAGIERVRGRYGGHERRLEARPLGDGLRCGRAAGSRLGDEGDQRQKGCDECPTEGGAASGRHAP